MDDENIFDDDDALDYIIHEDSTNDNSEKQKNGCLGMVILILVPVCMFKYLF